MERTEAIEWLKNIKEKYIHGGDDFYDHQRRTAIDYAICVLENIEKPVTNADRIRAMSDEELAEFLCGVYQDECGKFINGTIIFDYDEDKIAEWLKQPAEVDKDA